MTRKVHPAAAVFPMLPDDELQALADDIAANGLIHPVVVDKDGRVVDGRNRLAACELADVEPQFIIHDGDPAAYVLAANVTRRHMTTGARAMATAVVLAADGKRKDGRWTRGSVPDNRESPNSAWRDAMSNAGLVLDVTPEVAPAVIAGAVSLHAAHADAVKAREASESLETRLERLPADLAALVREEQLTLAGAEADSIERQRIHREAVERDAERLRKFISGWFTFSTLQSNPDRDDVLGALAPPDREQLDEISGSITWTKT